jgi:phosphatidylserine/phosphatidylglycerophosphate/cardiolipin synthase-like enzyme
VTSAGAEAATESFAERDDVGPHDAALPFAWSTASIIEPWVEGEVFFPKIFADIESAHSSIHILLFGWREGEIGMRMASQGRSTPGSRRHHGSTPTGSP